MESPVTVRLIIFYFLVFRSCLKLKIVCTWLIQMSYIKWIEAFPGTRRAGMSMNTANQK